MGRQTSWEIYYRPFPYHLSVYLCLQDECLSYSRHFHRVLKDSLYTLYYMFWKLLQHPLWFSHHSYNNIESTTIKNIVDINSYLGY